MSTRQRVSTRAGMATMPGRERCLPLALSSIAPQVEETYLAVNEGAQKPESKPASVQVISTESDDRAKFIAAPGYDGVFLTVDDDIIYPRDYADSLASRAAMHPEVPVGYHGSILTGSDDYYAAGARSIIRYFGACAIDTHVDVIGTGTMAFVPAAIGFELSWLSTRGVTDLEFSAALRERNVRPLVLAHSAGWIKPVPPELRNRSITSASRANLDDTLNVRDAARAIVQSRFR